MAVQPAAPQLRYRRRERRHRGHRSAGRRADRRASRATGRSGGSRATALRDRSHALRSRVARSGSRLDCPRCPDPPRGAARSPASAGGGGGGGRCRGRDRAGGESTGHRRAARAGDRQRLLDRGTARRGPHRPRDRGGDGRPPRPAPPRRPRRRAKWRSFVPNEPASRSRSSSPAWNEAIAMCGPRSPER